MEPFGAIYMGTYAQRRLRDRSVLSLVRPDDMYKEQTPTKYVTILGHRTALIFSNGHTWVITQDDGRFLYLFRIPTTTEIYHNCLNFTF